MPISRQMDRKAVVQFSSVQFSCSVMSNSLWSHESQHTRPPCPSPAPGVYTNPCLQSRDAIQPSHLLLLSPIPPCIRVFSNESTLHMRWLKYWGFSCSISPSNEHPGLISSFRMDWLDLLAVQGTLRIFSNTIVQKYQFFFTYTQWNITQPLERIHLNQF